GPADPGLHPGTYDGGEPAPRPGDDPRRFRPVLRTADQCHAAGTQRRAAGLGDLFDATAARALGPGGAARVSRPPPCAPPGRPVGRVRAGTGTTSPGDPPEKTSSPTIIGPGTIARPDLFCLPDAKHV